MTHAPAAAAVDPLITFYRFIPTTRLPQRADKSAAGTLPTRAFRYCEPVVTASAFGYYVFPPMNLSLIWDGHQVTWTYPGADGWMPLKTAQFPDFAAHFDARAPEDIKGFSPPFLGALQEPGVVQMWSGLIAKTAPGVSLLVRAPANLPRNGGYDLYEGIIETDHWFGPLITNMRLTKTNTPITFDAEMPFLQVQPLPRPVLAEATMSNYQLVPEIDTLRPEEWDDFYHTVVRPNVDPNRKRGAYAAEVRKSRKGAEPE